MLRVIFDTNIYGLLIKEKNAFEIENRIVEDKSLVVYNYKPIRDELRGIPKMTRLSRKTRNLVLNVYDKLTKNHFLENSIDITYLARKYHNHYRNQGGVYGWDTNIRVDFMIVACASINGLDVIYSEDAKTLICKKARKAYHHINIKEGLRTPYFLSYKELLIKYSL